MSDLLEAIFSLVLGIPPDGDEIGRTKSSLKENAIKWIILSMLTASLFALVIIAKDLPDNSSKIIQYIILSVPAISVLLILIIKLRKKHS